MNILRQVLRKRRLAAHDEGFSLTETIVAMFILALVSMGLLQTLMMALSANRDSRTRMVAANLAAEEIDKAREEGDLFQLLPVTRAPKKVGTDTFHVSRSTGWVSDPNKDFDCGAGGAGSLRYKRVAIEVTWDNMRPGSEPVRSSTVIDPGTRINDPEKGTILVSVLNAAGTGSQGVNVTATPLSGGAATTPQVTDMQGCAYLLKVVPGEYRIEVSRAGYVDSSQVAVPSQIFQVAAGASASAGFQYDNAGKYTVTYPGSTTEPIVKPTNLKNSFVSSYGTYVSAGTGGSPTPTSPSPKTFSLHPFTSGYEIFPGTCHAADPAAWLPDATHAAGHRQPAVAVAPGGAATVPVSMGIVKLNTGTTNQSLKAVSVPDTTNFPDDPCNTTVETLTFGNAITAGKATIALPAGKWRLYTGLSGSSTQTTAVTSGLTGVVTASAAPDMLPTITSSVDPAGVVTIDPRGTL